MTSEKCKLQISSSSALERGRAVQIVLKDNQDSIEPHFAILPPPSTVHSLRSVRWEVMVVLNLIGGSLHNVDNESSGLVGRPLCQVTSLKTSKKPPPAVISTDYDRKLAFWKPQKPLGDVTSSSNSWKKLDFVPFGNQHLTLSRLLVKGAESHSGTQSYKLALLWHVCHTLNMD